MADQPAEARPDPPPTGVARLVQARRDVAAVNQSGVPVPWRTIMAAIGAAGAAYVGWHLLLDLQKIITWVIVAGFFAIVLNPLVDFLVYRAHLRRGLAAFVVFILGVAAVAGLLYLLIRPIVSEVQTFVNDYPRLLEDAQNGRGPIGHLVKRYDLVTKARNYEPKLQAAIQNSGGQAITILQKVGNGAVAVLTILVLTFLMLLEGPRTLAGAVGLVRADRQVRLKRVGNQSARAITGYMAGNVLISLIASLVTYLGLLLFGVPFRGVAALWVGFADLIPLIGATLGAVPTVLLAFTHSTTAGIGMIIVYVVYQQFENHVIQVAIMSRTVRLSPLAVLVALLAGVQLFGLLGALLAIPVAGILQVVGKELYQERQRQRADEELEHAPPVDDPPRKVP